MQHRAGRLLAGLVMLALVSRTSAAGGDARVVRRQQGWPAVFELNAGDSFRLGERTVRLVSFEEHWQPDHWVQGNRERRTLESDRKSVV